MKYIVYLTINTVNRFIYIGVHKVKDINKFDGYIGCGVSGNSAANKTPFQKAVFKYGYDKFERITLGVFDTAEEAYIQEKELVTKEFIQRNDVYNAALGGGGKGGNYTSIVQYTLDGKFIKIWKSLIDAYKFYNKKSHSRLVKCLSGKDATYLGFQWRYWEEDFKLVIPPAKALQLPLYQYSIEGLLIQKWSNKLKAAKSLDCSSSGLRHATQSLKIYHGYQWRYFINDAPDSIPEYIDPNIVLQLDKDTGKIVKKWSRLVDALEEGFNVSRTMIPRYGKAKAFTWVYKKNYIDKTMI